MSTYLLLPIHRPEADYWAKNERRQAQLRQELVEHPYLESVLAGLDRPPWLVNDLLGFLAIMDDGGNCLLGIVYLKRRFLPPESRLSNGEHVNGLPRPNHHIIYFTEITKRRVDTTNNGSFVTAAEQIVAEAQEFVRRSVRYGRRASVWTGIGLECIDFARAYRSRQRDS